MPLKDLLDKLRDKLAGPTPPPAPVDPTAPPAPAPTPEARKPLWQRAVNAALVAGFLAGWVLFLLGKAPQPPAPPPLIEAAPAAGGDLAEPPAMGWCPDQEAVRAVEQALPTPSFADTPAFRQSGPPGAGGRVYLWDAYRKLFGVPPPPQDQNPAGSCVSFGTGRAYERSLAVQIALRGEPFEFRPVSEEVIYAGSRVEVGGGRLGRGDGSVGAWAARFVREWGGLPKGVYGRHDLTRYDPQRCRDWGAPGAGVPDELEPEAKKFPAGDVARVGTWDQAKVALDNGYGVAVCSSQGFARQRDARGVAAAQGRWQHCMCLDGYHTDEAGREYGHIENSWGGGYHVGPVGWGDPSPAGFWAEAGVVDRMLRQGDSWAISSVRGFPRQQLDWFSAAPARRDARRPEPAALALAW